MNDVRNLQTAIQTTKEAGGHCQAAISYTTSEIHTIDYFVKLAKELSQTGRIPFVLGHGRRFDATNWF